MWRKIEEPQAQPLTGISTSAPISTKTISTSQDSSLPPLSMRPVACISQGIHIKGEISGKEDLFVDGDVEGLIQITEGNVTVGPNGHVHGLVEAREIAVRGEVEGDLNGRERVQVWRTGKITGDIRAKRIMTEEGATVKGKIETLRDKQEARVNREESRPATREAVEIVPISRMAS